MSEGLGNARYAAAIEVLVKNILVEPAALYRIPRLAQHFDAKTIGANNLNDDSIGRALEKLFRAQRATIQTKLTLHAVEAFKIDVSQIHNDSTTVKFHGTYKHQNRRAAQLKRGHSIALTLSNSFTIYQLRAMGPFRFISRPTMAIGRTTPCTSKTG